MPYSTDNDLLKEYSESELAKLSGGSGTTVNTDRTDYARSNADALIDAYLFGRVPDSYKTSVPQIITKISVDITIAYLYDIAYCNGSVPNAVTWRKINAVKMLKDIQKGDIQLIDSNPGVNSAPPIFGNKNSKSQVFNDDILDEFMEWINSYLIYDSKNKS